MSGAAEIIPIASAKASSGESIFRFRGDQLSGFALGHNSGRVSLTVMLDGCSFSMSAIAGEHMRQFGQALLNAADLAAKAKATADADLAAAAPKEAET